MQMVVIPKTPIGAVSASSGGSPGIRPTHLPDPTELSVGRALPQVGELGAPEACLAEPPQRP